MGDFPGQLSTKVMLFGFRGLASGYDKTWSDPLPEVLCNHTGEFQIQPVSLPGQEQIQLPLA